MDRRRAVALIATLGLCLALLGSWFVRIDKEDAPAAPPPAAAASNEPKLTAEIVQAPRKNSKDDRTVSPAAPIGPGVFRGRVIDAVSREPILEFTVELLQLGSPEDPPPRIKQSFRAKDGRFTYRGLPIGRSVIFTTAPGYQRFDILDAAIAENEQPQEILIPMRAGLDVRGRIVDEITRDGIASATISFRDASVGRYDGNYRFRPSSTSRKDGSFTLDGVPPGAVRLEVRAGGYVRREIETFVSGKAAPVEIALAQGGAVSGYLAGTDGLTPVAGEVALANLDEGTVTHISTGPAGEFTFLRLSAGRHRLIARGGGLTGEREISLAHNEHLEGIVLPMTAQHTLRGVISGLRPEERKQAMIVVSTNERIAITPQTSADEHGAYEIRGVAPGRIWIDVATPRRGRLTREVEMPAHEDLTVNFEFKSGARLTGRVTRGGKPLDGAFIGAGTMSVGAENGELQLSTVSSSNGDYVIEDVPNGEYVLMAESYISPAVRVSGDTTFDIDVPEAQLSGRLFQEGGKVPVVGAIVDVAPAQRALYARMDRRGSRSDHFGQFSVSGLQPGEFLLTVYKPGYELYRAPLSYGSPVSDMLISMRPARGVEIRARDAESNAAVSSVTVVEIFNGMRGIVLQLQADQNGISYLPSGLSGNSLRISAANYVPTDIPNWNGQPLDLNLHRQPSR